MPCMVHSQQAHLSLTWSEKCDDQCDDDYHDYDGDDYRDGSRERNNCGDDNGL